MTNTKRWLDELPLGSHERELLMVGKAARPAEGAIDQNWNALCAALGTTAAISGTFATSAAANSAAATVSASAKVGASLAASKAAGTGLLIVAVKSLVVGVGVGLAIMGAATVAERASDRSVHPTALTQPAQPANARRALAGALADAPLTRPATQADAAREEPAVSPASSASSQPRPRDLGAGPVPVSNSASAAAASATSAISAEEKTASLARQARELAELKRLIDSGASQEALRRLNENFSAGTASVLSEERDALHVQALARAQRRNEARAFARQFLIRYPHSPYFETIRRLLTEE